MSKLRALIVDDERLARKELAGLLTHYDQVIVVDEAVNADDALEKIEKHNPDVVFLDIQMPGKTGFDLLEMLDSTPRIIFTTAYDEYALKAFEVNALDYLLKPIREERFRESMQKLLHEEKDKLNSRAMPSSEEETRNKLGLEDQVFVKDGDKCWFVKLASVRLFESDGNYIKVYFDSYRPMIHKSLNALDEKLDGRFFFRASRKHIINLSWIENIEPWFNGGLIVKLKGGEKVEISRRQASKFKDKMSL
jgi:two-component system LytT family response regulator